MQCSFFSSSPVNCGYCTNDIFYRLYLGTSRLIEILPTMHFWNSSKNTVNATRDLASDEEYQISENVQFALFLISHSFHHWCCCSRKWKVMIMWKILQSWLQYSSDCLAFRVNSVSRESAFACEFSTFQLSVIETLWARL